jgi:LuxR family transcriptional regulator, maltose regulon positive regulatory protein
VPSSGKSSAPSLGIEPRCILRQSGWYFAAHRWQPSGARMDSGFVVVAADRAHPAFPSASRGPARTWIRDSKLVAPRLRVASVERERLLTQLAAAADSPVVLVSASAGYGKSTLAAQWSARCQRPVAWITLDRGDNDPVVFLSYVAHALDRLAPVASELLDELSAPAPRIDDVVLPSLAVELARLSPLELILDDLHELSQARSMAALSFLLKEMPQGSQVVLVTRVDPELPLARYRVSGDLLEIGADKLALDAEETRALSASSGGLFSERSLELLRQRTEGWAAGIALAMHAVDDLTSENDVAEVIAGHQRQIANYLVEVVLARETEERRRFLLATSVLRRMTASLCDAVLGIAGSNDVLRELEQSNSFVIALDDHHGWYRYHHLFGELLRSELDRLHPELAVVYLARAAEWLEQDAGDPEEAFRCAHECGDLERAGRIALASWDALGSRGQLATLRLWFVDCTEEEVASDPRLALAAAWVYTLLGGVEKAQRFALAAERGDLDMPSADGATSLRSSLANLRTALAPRGIHQMLADAEFVYAAEKEPAETRWLIGGCRGVGIASLLLGRPDEAITALREALMLSSGRPELTHSRILCLGYIAFAAADAGNWSEGRRWAKEARALVAEHHLGGFVTAVPVFTAKAMVHAHDGDFDRATHELAEALRLKHLVGGARWMNADMNIRWGNINIQLGNRGAARQQADDARAALRGYPDPGALPDRLAQLDQRIDRAEALHLTPAELRIAAFLPAHRSLREIADVLNVSRTTVKTQVAAIYSKLGVTTRSEAVERLAQLSIPPADAMGA